MQLDRDVALRLEIAGEIEIGAQRALRDVAVADPRTARHVDERPRHVDRDKIIQRVPVGHIVGVRYF